jgi:putative transposase
MYEFIKSHRGEYPVDVMCRILGVAPSGYYDWLGQSLPQSASTEAADSTLWASA